MSRWPAVLLAVALVAACSDDDAAPEPPAPGERTTTTEAVDRSGIALTPVGGETTTTIRETGTARLVGTVRGPDGLVPGAAVRVERLVAGREIRTDVVTGADGRFVLDRVPGGRYRVRAFLPPTLAQLEPELRFLTDGEEHAFDLVVERHQGLVVRSSAAPSPALRGRPVNVVVLVARRAVDADGVVRTNPISGLSIELVGLGRWVLRDDTGGQTTSTTSFSPTTSTTSTRSDATGRTDSSGRVRFELSCRVTGSPGLAVRIPVAVAQPTGQAPTAGGPSTTTTIPQERVETIALELPACVEAPAATSTTTTTTTLGTTTEPATDDDG